MAVRDEKMARGDFATWKCMDFHIGTTALSQTDLEVDSAVPGFTFQVERVEIYATAVTATISANLKIGATTCLASAVTPVAGTATAATLATDITARRGTDTEALNLEYTSNGSGAMTNGRVRVWVRPFPLNGESMPTAGV